MPSLTRPRSAQGHRKNSGRRSLAKVRRNKGRAGRPRRQENPRIIGDSLFALTLTDKPGLEVHQKLKDKDYSRHNDDYPEMYADLLAAFKKAVKLTTGEDTGYDPLGYGYSLEEALGMIVLAFERQIVPEGMELSVERRNDGLEQYHFVIYTECVFNEFWHLFEIKPVVEYLNKKMPELHDLFLHFISLFSRMSGIRTWWTGGLGYSDYQLSELMEDEEFWEDRMGPMTAGEYATEKDAEDSRRHYSRAWDDYFHYHAGEVQMYREFISSSRMTSEELTAELRKHDPKNPVAAFMAYAISMVSTPETVDTFCGYDLVSEYNHVEGITFDQMSAILWDTDTFFRLEEEALDASAQGVGIVWPLLAIQVSADTKALDFSRISETIAWPQRISDIHDRFWTMVNLITKKPKKNKNG